MYFDYSFHKLNLNEKSFNATGTSHFTKPFFVKMSESIAKLEHLKGPFKNYVDILTFFDYLPTSTWTFFTLNVDKKKHFLTTYPPHLVHVVFERPLNVM